MAKPNSSLAAVIADRMTGHPIKSEALQSNPFVHMRLVEPATGAAWHLAEYDQKRDIVLAYQGVMALNPWAYMPLSDITDRVDELGQCSVTIDERFESCEAHHIAD